MNIRDPNAFICYKSETELINVQKLEAKINVLTADIKDKLSNCTKYVQNNVDYYTPTSACKMPMYSSDLEG